MDYSAKAGSRPPLILQYIIAAAAAAVFVARDPLSSVFIPSIRLRLIVFNFALRRDTDYLGFDCVTFSLPSSCVLLAFPCVVAGLSILSR